MVTTTFEELKVRKAVSALSVQGRIVVACMSLLCLSLLIPVGCGGAASTTSNGSGSGTSGGGGTGTSGGGSGMGGGSGNVVAVNISGGSTSFSAPAAVAIDGAGNVWTDNATGGAVTELTQSSKYAASSAVNIPGLPPHESWLAIDKSGNVWISNFASTTLTGTVLTGTVTELTKASGYSAASALTIQGGNTNFELPTGIAVDNAGNIWIANFGGGSVTELPYAAVSAPNATAASIANSAINISLASLAVDVSYNGSNKAVIDPTYIAVDPTGNVWIANFDLYTLTGTTAGGSIIELTKASGYSPASALNISGWDGPISDPFVIAFDSAGNLWLTGVGGASISSGGVAVTELTQASGYAPAKALNIPGNSAVTFLAGIAADGAGNIWIANTGLGLPANGATGGSGSVIELTKSSGYAMSSAVTYNATSAGFQTPVGIAIDAAGNVWIANSGATTGGNNGIILGTSGSVTELVGAASPVTPPAVVLTLHRRVDGHQVYPCDSF